MSTTTNDQGRKTFTALEAIPFARRVAISTSSTGVVGVIVAGTAVVDIGVSTNPAATGELVVVALPNALGTVECAVTGTPVTPGASTGKLYSAAEGYLTPGSIATSFFWGIAHGTGVSGDVIEVQRSAATI
jgi:hypothetical protein